MAKEIDINEVLNRLLDHIAGQERELVWLRLQLELLTRDNENEVKEEDDDNKL